MDLNIHVPYVGIFDRELGAETIWPLVQSLRLLLRPVSAQFALSLADALPWSRHANAHSHEAVRYCLHKNTVSLIAEVQGQFHADFIDKFSAEGPSTPRPPGSSKKFE